MSTSSDSENFEKIYPASQLHFSILHWIQVLWLYLLDNVSSSGEAFSLYPGATSSSTTKLPGLWQVHIGAKQNKEVTSLIKIFLLIGDRRGKHACVVLWNIQLHGSPMAFHLHVFSWLFFFNKGVSEHTPPTPPMLFSFCTLEGHFLWWDPVVSILVLPSLWQSV